MTKPLASAIVRSGLGLRQRSESDSWVGVHPELANVYMCSLVNHLAHRESLYPVTDQELPHNAMLEWDLDRITDVLLGMRPRPEHRDATHRFMTATVQIVVPEGLADLEDNLRSVNLMPRRVRVQLKADAARESPVGWLFRAGQLLR